MDSEQSSRPPPPLVQGRLLWKPPAPTEEPTLSQARRSVGAVPAGRQQLPGWGKTVSQLQAASPDKMPLPRRMSWATSCQARGRAQADQPAGSLVRFHPLCRSCTS